MSFMERMNDKLWPVVGGDDADDGGEATAEAGVVPSVGLTDEEKQAMGTKYWGR